MAFKKTGGRSALVQPTGLPNFSGFKQAAASYNQLGEMAYGIGLDDRKREFNQLIRQAEIDGRTAGVVYEEDEDGNKVLVPLTNFDYAKASETYAEADKNQILATYRKAAVQTYVNAAANDINDAAAKALIDNPNDPAAIRSSAQGYLQGIEDLDPEIYTALAPKVSAAFTRVENQALGQQRQESIDFAIAQGTKAYNQNSIELGVLYAKSQGTNNPAQASAIDERIEEILGEQADIILSLEANEMSAKAIDEMQDAQATIIASKTAQAAVERSYALNGEAMTYQMILEAVNEAEMNPDVDSAVLRQIMTQSVTSLAQIDAAQTKEETELRSAIYGDLFRKVVIDGLDITQELSNPESPIHQLEDTSIANLYNTSTGMAINNRNRKAADNEAIWGRYKTAYENDLEVIKSPDVTSFAAANEAMKNIFYHASMGLYGPESPKLLIQAQSAFKAASPVFNAQSINERGSALLKEFGPNSTFSVIPAEFESETYMRELESIGVIGKGGFFTTRKEYQSKVNGYALAYKKRRDTIKLARSAEEDFTHGIYPSAKGISALSEMKGFDKALIKVADAEGNETFQAVDINLLSDDPAVYEASKNAIAAFAVETGGLLHPEAKKIMDNAMMNVDVAQTAREVMAQTMSAIRQDTTLDERHVEGIFYQNLKPETVSFLQMAARAGDELAVQAFSPLNQTSQNRVASTIVAKLGYTGMSEEEAMDKLFEETWSKSLEAKGFFKLLQPAISADNNDMLYQMANAAGVNNVEDMFISDPIVNDLMKRLFVGEMLRAPMIEPVEAMLNALRQVGTRIGPQINAYTGGLEYVTNPILPRAQATVGNAGVTLSQSDIDQDIKDMFLNSEMALTDPKFAEQIASVGEEIGPNAFTISSYGGDRYVSGATIHYIANETYGAKQTYTVLLKTTMGDVIPLLDNYAYDFKKTQGYESFQEAVSQLKTDRMKQFWSVYGLIDNGNAQLQSTFDSLERTRDDRSLGGIINMYNSMFRDGMDDSPITQEEASEFYYMLDRIISLGWR